jgi:hypothetical protein
VQARYDSPMRLLMSVVLAMFLLGAGAADRSRVVRVEFQRLNPCPANGATRGACPGFEADHVIALCAGGADHPSNMEWRTRDDHALKTKFDTMQCRLKRTAAKQ